MGNPEKVAADALARAKSNGSTLATFFKPKEKPAEPPARPQPAAVVPEPPAGPPPNLGADIVAIHQRLDEQVAAIEFLQRTVGKLLEMVEGMGQAQRDLHTRPRQMPGGVPETEDELTEHV